MLDPARGGLALSGDETRGPTGRGKRGKVQVVYFNQITSPGVFDEPRIKIGESSDHGKRLKDLAKSSFGVRFEVQPLCMVRGTRADEQRILRHFAGYKVEGEEETFWPTDEVVDYIRWLRDQYFVWVPDCDKCPDVEDLDLVESDLWMPGPGRSKKAPPQKDLFNDFGALKLPPRDVTVDDFYTGQTIVEAARRAMGGIDLDPASHAYANMVVKAPRFFTVNDDGLTQDWHGRVWLNPPFSQWSVWVKKIVREWVDGRVKSMCVLCATRTLTAQYFGDVHRRSDGLCVLHGRIPFWGGRATSSPDDGHAVFYFGDDLPAFEAAFKDIGHLYRTARLA